MKTYKVMVFLEIRAEDDDEDTMRSAIKDALQEAAEDDTFDYTAEEMDED